MHSTDGKQVGNTSLSDCSTAHQQQSVVTMWQRSALTDLNYHAMNTGIFIQLLDDVRQLPTNKTDSI